MTVSARPKTVHELSANRLEHWIYRPLNGRKLVVYHFQTAQVPDRSLTGFNMGWNKPMVSKLRRHSVERYYYYKITSLNMNVLMA